jgi:hypothetical protein
MLVQVASCKARDLGLPAHSGLQQSLVRACTAFGRDVCSHSGVSKRVKHLEANAKHKHEPVLDAVLRGVQDSEPWAEN